MLSKSKWSPDSKLLKYNLGVNTDGCYNYSHTEIRMLIQSFDIKSLEKTKNNQDTVWSVPKNEVIRK